MKRRASLLALGSVLTLVLFATNSGEDSRQRELCKLQRRRRSLDRATARSGATSSTRYRRVGEAVVEPHRPGELDLRPERCSASRLSALAGLPGHHGLDGEQRDRTLEAGLLRGSCGGRRGSERGLPSGSRATRTPRGRTVRRSTPSSTSSRARATSRTSSTERCTRTRTRSVARAQTPGRVRPETPGRSKVTSSPTSSPCAVFDEEVEIDAGSDAARSTGSREHLCRCPHSRRRADGRRVRWVGSGSDHTGPRCPIVTLPRNADRRPCLL